MEIAAGGGVLGRVFRFGRGEGVGSRPVSSHRRDAEVAEKGEKQAQGWGSLGFSSEGKERWVPSRSGVSMAVF